MPTKVLFLCTMNRHRSLTAEHHFANLDGFDFKSAGTSEDCATRLNQELSCWADVIVAMEPHHKSKALKLFPLELSGKKFLCVGIPDEYEYMESSLLWLLDHRVKPLLLE